MTLQDMVVQACFLWGCNIDPPPKKPVIVNNTVSVKYKQPKAYYISLIKKYSKNPSWTAAQIEQESNWNAKAKSWAKGQGLGQFIPSTGKWAARGICAHLGKYTPFNPVWSIRCSVIYMEHLSKHKDYGDRCTNLYVTLMRYNGGNYVKRELARSWTKSEGYSLKRARLYCRRASWACKENYEYPNRIAKRQIKYVHLGGKSCPIVKTSRTH